MLQFTEIDDEDPAVSMPAIESMVKVLESVPVESRARIIQQLQEYLDDLLDDLPWDETFARTQDQLAAMADQARRDIAAGLAEPFDPSRL